MTLLDATMTETITLTCNARKKQKPMNKDSKLIKYWNQRYNLFSRFDDGIMMDDESWYSVTPENIAQHIANRFRQSLGDGHRVIVDGFCGVGGNLIQFALACPYYQIVACDINPDKLKMAKHNAKIYGVEHQCEFVLGDFMKLMQCLESDRIDAVFFSPPWGGINYQDCGKYSMSFMTPNGYDVVHTCRKHLTNNIAFLLPRNIDLQEVKKTLLSERYQTFECEENIVGTKTKTITMYFGDLLNEVVETDSSEDKEIT